MLFRILLIILLCPVLAVSQNNTLSGKISEIKDDYIYLHTFYGAENKRFDSIQVQPDGSFTYQFQNNAYKGMYRLRWGKNQMMDIIYNDENIRFQTTNNSIVDSLVYFHSPENQLYFDYLQKRNVCEFKLELIYPLINMYPKDDPFYASITKQYDIVNDEMSEWASSIVKHHPNKFAARLIRSDYTPMPSSFLNEEQHVNFLKIHFFDNIDFNDTSLLNSNLFSNITIQYLSLYQNNRLDKDHLQVEYIKAVSIIMEKAKNSPEVYAYIMDYLINGFSSYGFEKVLTFIADNIDLEDQCIDEEKKALLEKKVDSHKKFSIGKQIPDIETIDLKGNSVKLSSIESEYTILLFWATWCPSCKGLVNDLKKIYLPDNHHKLEIVAIAIDESKDELEKFLNDGDYNWINVCDFKKWKGDLVQQLDIYATPTMFLLDKSLTIQAKPITYNELTNELFKRNVLE